jgi:hypothetical protein
LTYTTKGRAIKPVPFHIRSFIVLLSAFRRQIGVFIADTLTKFGISDFSGQSEFPTNHQKEEGIPPHPTLVR